MREFIESIKTILHPNQWKTASSRKAKTLIQMQYHPY